MIGQLNRTFESVNHKQRVSFQLILFKDTSKISGNKKKGRKEEEQRSSILHYEYITYIMSNIFSLNDFKRF